MLLFILHRSGTLYMNRQQFSLWFSLTCQSDPHPPPSPIFKSKNGGRSLAYLGMGLLVPATRTFVRIFWFKNCRVSSIPILWLLIVHVWESQHNSLRQGRCMHHNRLIQGSHGHEQEPGLSTLTRWGSHPQTRPIRLDFGRFRWAPQSDLT